jgi:ribosome-binding protein aMBF1 (putative translation factor)
MKCDFCKTECDGKNIIRSNVIAKKDGSDIKVCNDCLNLYANQEWEKLTLRIKEGVKV